MNFLETRHYKSADQKNPILSLLFHVFVLGNLIHPCFQSHLYENISSVQSLSRVWSLRPHGLQHARLPCPSPTPGACSNSSLIESVKPSNHLIHCCPLLLLPSIFPSINVFQMSQFFASGGQGIGVSASASVLPMNIQDWFPLGWTVWISLQSKGLSRVFSNTTVQKHQFLGSQLSL